MTSSLFWPSSSSDWASWVQALGTIIAVLAAWRISRGDALALLERDYESELKEEFFAAASAVRFTQELMGAMFELSDALTRNDRVDAGLAFRRVSESLEWARQVPVELLPPSVADCFVKARMVAAKVIWCELNVSGRRRLSEIEEQTRLSMVCAGEIEKHYMAAYPRAPSYAHKRYGLGIPLPNRRRRVLGALRRLVPTALRERYRAWRARATDTGGSATK